MIGRAMMRPAVARPLGVKPFPLSMRLGRFMRLLSISIALSIMPAAVGLLSGCGSCVGVDSKDGGEGPAQGLQPTPSKEKVCPIGEQPKVIEVKGRGIIDIELDLPKGVKLQNGATPELYFNERRLPIRLYEMLAGYPEERRNAEASIKNNKVLVRARPLRNGNFTLFFTVKANDDSEIVLPFTLKISGLTKRSRPKGKTKTPRKRPRLRF